LKIVAEYKEDVFFGGIRSKTCLGESNPLRSIPTFQIAQKREKGESIV